MNELRLSQDGANPLIPPRRNQFERQGRRGALSRRIVLRNATALRRMNA
jgi:hypothetical protein